MLSAIRRVVSLCLCAKWFKEQNEITSFTMTER